MNRREFAKLAAAVVMAPALSDLTGTVEPQRKFSEGECSPELEKYHSACKKLKNLHTLTNGLSKRPVPQLFDNFDEDKMVRSMAGSMGIPPGWIKSGG